MDGKTLADLAKRLVNVMNNKALWDALDIGFYQSFEDNVCREAFKTNIAFLLNIRKKTAKEIEEQKDEAIRQFKNRCKVKYWVDKAERDLEEALKHRKNFEKDDTLIWDIAKYVGGAVTVIAGTTWWAFSDAKLKDNLTVVRDSGFEAIGLRKVKWIWNEEAEKLGLRGQDTGVVAQDVEQIYPWAVIEGHDGYKRVNYLFLRLMVVATKLGQRYGIPRPTVRSHANNNDISKNI